MDFPRQTVGESADYANFAEVQAAKTSSHREQQIAGCEIVLPLGAANCRLRNRPPAGSGKLQAAKPSSRRERQIAGCETVLPLGAANCRLRNRPPAGSSKLQAAKPSSRWERQIASCENVLPLGAANCRLRKSPPIRSGKLQQSTVGAYRIRPNTYAMTSGRIQGVCDTPLHRFLFNNH